MVRVAGVEGGGTTWVCALAEGDPLRIIERAEFPTTTPAETLGAVHAWLQKHSFDSLGIATFGPIDAHTTSPTYGRITKTPKPGWRDAEVVATLTRGLPKHLPVKFDTDVNAPALAEARAAAEAQESVIAYATVGTGIGVGLFVNGKPVHGLLHPEGGHISVPRHPKDTYDGHFHALNCQGWCEVEAMCNSAALAKRAGLQGTHGLANLDDDHPVWDYAAHYIAAMCANLVLTVSPQRIVLSGGVMKRLALFPMIREKTVTMLNGYIPLVDANMIDQYIVPSRWGNDAGITGALTLALDALHEQKEARKGPTRADKGNDDADATLGLARVLGLVAIGAVCGAIFAKAGR